MFKHLKKVKMTYFEHLCQSFYYSRVYLLSSMKGIVHGINPYFFDNYINECDIKIKKK